LHEDQFGGWVMALKDERPGYDGLDDVNPIPDSRHAIAVDFDIGRHDDFS
jgi:hypothetical protein